MTAADDRLDALAEDVRAELSASGLPILAPGYERGADRTSGVSVDVDEGRVWVRWNLRGPLSEASGRAFQVGAFRPDGSEIHPALRHHGAVTDALGAALTAILRAAGYGVRANVDDFDPDALVVSARGPGPHWRDPVVPPLAGASGYTPGVRVRLVGGEFAGAPTTVVGVAHREGRPLRYRVEHPGGAGELDVPPEQVTLAADD